MLFMNTDEHQTVNCGDKLGWSCWQPSEAIPSRFSSSLHPYNGQVWTGSCLTGSQFSGISYAEIEPLFFLRLV